MIETRHPQVLRRIYMRWNAVHLASYLLQTLYHHADSMEAFRPQGQRDVMMEFDVSTVKSTDGVPNCTVHQLLPNLNNGHPGGWMEGSEERSPPYNCSCPYYKAK